MTPVEKNEYISASRLIVSTISCSILLAVILGCGYKYLFISKSDKPVHTDSAISTTQPPVRNKVDKSNTTMDVPAANDDRCDNVKTPYLTTAKKKAILAEDIFLLHQASSTPLF